MVKIRGCEFLLFLDLPFLKLSGHYAFSKMKGVSQRLCHHHRC